uniref:Luc7-like protein 3 n=1 Tax=Caenorhabditis tropicalis TaxID=1561998 RepID=A0A1I7UK53_9PELO
MTDYMAQMLNELMGSQRDAMPGEKRELRYDDPNVCTDFLVGFCTHEIFRNTKNDLGFCKYSIHDENLKNSYRTSDRKGKMGFENRFLERIRRIHEDVRRKIQKHEDRLAVTQGESKSAEETFGLKIQEIDQRCEMLTKKMEELVEEAAVEGEKGNVEAAQTAMEKADKAKFEIEELTFEKNNLMGEKERAVNMEENVTAGNRQMQVCQICGCFMLQNDAPQRVDDHLTGKLHIAYQLIADTIKNLEQELQEQNDKRMQERIARRYDRSRSRSKDRKDRREGRSDKAGEKSEKSEKPERSEHRREHRDHRDHRDRHRDRGERDRSDRDRYRSDRDKDRRRHH